MNLIMKMIIKTNKSQIDNKLINHKNKMMEEITEVIKIQHIKHHLKNPKAGMKLPKLRKKSHKSLLLVVLKMKNKINKIVYMKNMEDLAMLLKNTKESMSFNNFYLKIISYQEE